jgi:hypothetical protein
MYVSHCVNSPHFPPASPLPIPATLSAKHTSLPPVPPPHHSNKNLANIYPHPYPLSFQSKLKSCLNIFDPIFNSPSTTKIATALFCSANILRGAIG